MRYGKLPAAVASYPGPLHALCWGTIAVTTWRPRGVADLLCMRSKSTTKGQGQNLAWSSGQGHFSTVKNLDRGHSSGHSAYGSDPPLFLCQSRLDSLLLTHRYQHVRMYVVSFSWPNCKRGAVQVPHSCGYTPVHSSCWHNR